MLSLVIMFSLSTYIYIYGVKWYLVCLKLITKFNCRRQILINLDFSSTTDRMMRIFNKTQLYRITFIMNILREISPKFVPNNLESCPYTQLSAEVHLNSKYSLH